MKLYKREKYKRNPTNKGRKKHNEKQSQNKIQSNSQKCSESMLNELQKKFRRDYKTNKNNYLLTQDTEKNSRNKKKKKCF